MGRSHGIQWTDELIRESILEVVSAMELDRMPTRSECEQYFRDTRLTNAISRRCGWYALAHELKLPVKDSETTFGKRSETAAAEALTERGYDVRKMPQNFPYDLLVDDCIKVDVKASRLYHGVNGDFYSYNLEKPYATCDIYILYLIGDDGARNEALIVPSKFVSTNTQISVGASKSKYRRFSGRWDYFDQYADFLSEVC